MKYPVLFSLVLNLLLPSFAYADAPAYLTPEDLGAFNTGDLVKQCGYIDGVSHWAELQDSLLFEPIYGRTYPRHTSVKISGKGFSFSINVPYEPDWKVLGKVVQPYLKESATRFSVGRVEIMNQYGPNGNTCAALRKYTVDVYPGMNLKKLDKQIRDRLQILHKEEAQTTAPDLASISLTIGTNRAMLLPGINESSNGYYDVGYNALAVERKGFVVVIRNPSPVTYASVDNEMIRMAASLK